MKKIALWFRIIRPQTLFASLCPVLIGLRLCSDVKGWIGAVTLLCALSLQVLSNLINDYYDFKKGADQCGRAGFKRALAEGEVLPQQIKKAIYITLSIAIALGLYLLLVAAHMTDGHYNLFASLPIFIIGVTALFFAWLYTATRYSLSYLGVADLFVFLYYGVVAATGTTYLQTHTFSLQSFYAGAVCGLISTCVLIINNLRDMESDRTVGKRTFPVRFGKKAGELGMLFVILLIPVFAYLAFGWHRSMFVILPALFLFARTRCAQGPTYNKCLLGAGMINLIYVILS